ncbi:MAG TPA: AMP-binding protein [Phototrophicaceae bacterium]|nr:AMP-binding protein [Phototrophicaceae bacterium]
MLTLSTRDSYHTLLDTETLRHADESPAIIYLSIENAPITVTRAEFVRQITAYAAALHGIGIQPRDLVVVAHTQDLESIYAFWGALSLGAIPSMFPTLTEKLDPDIYRANMSELVRRSEVKAVLTTDEFAPILAEGVGCPVYGSSALREHSGQFKPYKPNSDEIAFLQHSSGTTGLQKGVALAHRAVLNQLASYADAIDLSENDVIVSWLPLYHDMGLIAGFLMPLIQGIPLVLMSPFEWVKSPAMLFRAIHEYHGTLCWLPNFAYNHCARRIRQRDLEGLSAASMRMFINCSEPVYHESHEQFLERFAPLGVVPAMLGVSYAMAENTFAVTQTMPRQIPHLDVIDRLVLQSELRAHPVELEDANAQIKVSCGLPISGAAVRVLDPQGQPLPERHVGELAVKSDSMLSGYYKRPDLQPFRDGWYLTGDRGYLANGEVYIVGRSKDLIINAGKNVYPQDIEAIVNTVAGIHAGRAVAFGVPDEREGTELIAVVAEVETDDPDERKAITQAIRQTVVQSSTVTINFVQLVDTKWLIKTSSGKIARAANRDKWLAERASLS